MILAPAHILPNAKIEKGKSFVFFRLPIQTALSSLLLLLSFLLGSCGSLVSPEFRNVDNIRVEKLGKKESILLADVQYYNPNKTQLLLKEASGDAWVDGQWLGKFSVDSQIQIPARGNFSLPVTLKTDLGKLFQNSFSALLGGEITIRFKGKARVGKGFIFINYPIEYEAKKKLKMDN